MVYLHDHTAQIPLIYNPPEYNDPQIPPSSRPRLKKLKFLIMLGIFLLLLISLAGKYTVNNHSKGGCITGDISEIYHVHNYPCMMSLKGCPYFIFSS